MESITIYKLIKNRGNKPIYTTDINNVNYFRNKGYIVYCTLYHTSNRVK
jgi:hypothetical protein